MIFFTYRSHSNPRVAVAVSGSTSICRIRIRNFLGSIILKIKLLKHSLLVVICSIGYIKCYGRQIKASVNINFVCDRNFNPDLNQNKMWYPDPNQNVQNPPHCYPIPNQAQSSGNFVPRKLLNRYGIADRGTLKNLFSMYRYEVIYFKRKKTLHKIKIYATRPWKKTAVGGGGHITNPPICEPNP